MTRKQFFRDLSEKTLTKFANEKSEKTVNILTLCYKLAELALSRLEDRLFTHNNGYEYDYIKDREKLPQLISKFKSISLNDFTWNSFSKLFAGWMGKNKTCTVYDYNFTPNDAYSSEEFSLPETVNLKNLGLKGAALFSSEEDHLRPQANATLLINFESILQSLKYLPKK